MSILFLSIILRLIVSIRQVTMQSLSLSAIQRLHIVSLLPLLVLPTPSGSVLARVYVVLRPLSAPSLNGGCFVRVVGLVLALKDYLM